MAQDYWDDIENPATLANFDSGSLNTSETGDDDTDGFNERYGWYEITCVGDVAKFDLSNDAYTRKRPVFRFHSATAYSYIVKINGSTLRLKNHQATNFGDEIVDGIKLTLNMLDESSIYYESSTSEGVLRLRWP